MKRVLREFPGEARRLAVTFEEQSRAQAAERRKYKKQAERGEHDGFRTDEVVGDDDEEDWNPLEEGPSGDDA